MEVVVIGGGAAGMMAAGQAAARGAPVLLLEKNTRLGRKILITGKGRCNLTNDTDIQSLIDNIPGNGRFLFSAFHAFSNRDLVQFVESRGVPTKVERGKRVFPVSDKAEDIVGVFASFLREKGVRVIYENPASELVCDAGKVVGVKTSAGGFYPAAAVILATGGASYPGTGSTGDGYNLAAAVGHTIVPPRPSLIPLVTAESWVRDVQGLTLKNVRVSLATADGRSVGEDFGELLFTHFGVSGPTVLTLSRFAIEALRAPGVHLSLTIDLKPALSPEQVDERLQRDFLSYQRKQFKNALDDLLPRSLIPVIIRLSGIAETTFVHQITKAERLRLRGLMTSLPLTVTGTRPLAEAVVTAGGVSTKEINPKTMESKLISGLFFAGEVIDVDGFTGGFNLQAAFSTGFVAGTAAVASMAHNFPALGNK